MPRLIKITFVLVVSIFLSYSSLAMDHKLEQIFKEHIQTYEQKVHSGHNYPIEIPCYKEGCSSQNVVDILRSLQAPVDDRPSILMIERIDDQGNHLPFLPKHHRHYYDFDKHCLRCLHFYNQAKWPTLLVNFNQCFLYWFGYYSWTKHLVILHRGKIYDIDTKSNGVSQRQYFTENFVSRKDPELVTQFKVSFFFDEDNYIESDRYLQLMQLYNLSHKIKACHFRIALHKLLASLPDI